MEARYKERKQALLDECKIEPELFQRVLPRLDSFMDPFVEHFVRNKQCEHAETYMKGLLSDLERKNAESMAYRFGEGRLGLQRFVGQAEWDDKPMRAELVRQVGQQLGEDRVVPRGHVPADPLAPGQRAIVPVRRPTHAIRRWRSLRRKLIPTTRQRCVFCFYK